MSAGKLRQIAALAAALLMAGFVLPVATHAANKHGADLVVHVKVEHLGTRQAARSRRRSLASRLL